MKLESPYPNTKSTELKVAIFNNKNNTHQQQPKRNGVTTVCHIFLKVLAKKGKIIAHLLLYPHLPEMILVNQHNFENFHQQAQIWRETEISKWSVTDMEAGK